MKVTILIPARMAATRFPGKPLSLILGKPMIQWVYERGKESMADRVIVATDSTEIATAVRAFGGEVQMTRSDHPNGTQRITEVAERIETDLVINIQGDEPAIRPEAIDAVIQPLLANPNLEMSTLAEPIDRPEEVFDPNLVKVVFNKKGRALYFSRAPIPYHKHAGMDSPRWQTVAGLKHYRHIGIYGYQKAFLLDYCREPVCSLEATEGLEQLRALHLGAEIQVEITAFPSIGVDRPEDIEKAEKFLKEEGSFP